MTSTVACTGDGGGDSDAISVPNKRGAGELTRLSICDESHLEVKIKVRSETHPH